MELVADRRYVRPVKISASRHAERPWRVHTLAPDFTVLDVWQFELGPGTPVLDDVLLCFWSEFRKLSEDSLLARTRLRVGRWLKWDDHDFSLPIPGCEERSVGERLSPADRASSRIATNAASPIESPVVRTVYVLGDEALYEASNDTIHLMLHISVVDAGATLAVYIKSRGVFSRAYLAAIGPARHLVIYPAMTRRLETAWRSR